jgi:hypothetical protein
MAIPSTTLHRSSLNTSYNQSDSSSEVDVSNDFQKSEKNKVNTDHSASLDKPSIEAFIAQLENTGEAHSNLSNHLKKLPKASTMLSKN